MYGLVENIPPSAYEPIPYTFGTITQSYESIYISINHLYISLGLMPVRFIRFAMIINLFI